VTKPAHSPRGDIAVAQDGFDTLGPTVRTAQVESGRTVHYIAEDECLDGPTLLFFGGAGSTVRAFGLLEFARTLRQHLHIGVVCVERNGLGQTPFNPVVGPNEYAADVWSLLVQLGIDAVSLVAISGGGPYAARVASMRPERIRSLHLACAWSEAPQNPHSERSAVSTADMAAIAADPVKWWTFPANSSVHRIPGFDDSVIEEATRGIFATGRDTPPEGLLHAYEIYQSEPLPDLSTVRAPAFLYRGSADDVVPVSHLERWSAALPHVVARRIYPDEGHDVQYRHWDQILSDVAFLGERILVCQHGRSVLVEPARAEQLIADGATLGMCAWS